MMCITKVYQKGGGGLVHSLLMTYTVSLLYLCYTLHVVALIGSFHCFFVVIMLVESRRVLM